MSDLPGADDFPSDHTVLIQEGDDQRRYAQHERPCPACRAPFSEERIFHQSAFEPTDAELGIQDAFDDLPPEPSPSMLRKLQKAEEEESSSDEEIISPAKGKGKGKAVAKHKSKLGGRRSSRSNRKTKYAEGYEDSDDSLSDFIIQDDESETEKDRKRDTMMELLKQWRDQYPEDKTIIVSQWTSVLNLVEFYLHEQGFNFELYTGEMNANDRHQAVHTFMHNDDVTVMLMSLTAGGVGLNLTRANRVISLDFAWSEAIEAQAFDRTHRLGQRKEVEIYRLAIQNTVEAKVMALQEKKKHLADGSLGEGTGRKLGKLSVRELANLFGLDARGQIIE
ncbi:hypothetical protein FRC02_006003 [Tulasnella sp. 418]|nr:hypothetical protein FRC02_006003 [Tulasnella sp. 418]